VATDLQNAGVAPWQVESFLSQPDLDAAAISKLQAEAEDLNRDDRPVLEFRTARNLFRLTKPGADNAWRARLPRVRG
jgi:hypothetical protein